MRPVVPASVGLFLVFAALPVAVGADHPQEEGDVVFRHVDGNEWWVEVDVDGDVGWDVVRARDDGGDWVALEKKSWGVWAGSFHIEPGHRVQFQATYTPHSGRTVESCWFTHPQGEEQCGEEPASQVVFDHKGGNEWWVQVDVAGDETRVQSQDTGGPWVELEKKSWGDWAGSYHIEPGHEVRFRALVDGSWVESCWFTHPGGVTPAGGAKCSGGDPGPDPEPEPEPGPELVFDHRGGNEWWVEVHVDGSYNVHFVHAEDSSGETKRLELKDWGNWAGSFHIAPGDRVRFYANDRDGTPAMVSCWFTHPGGATPDGGQTCEGTSVGSEPEPEPEPTVDVAFAPKAGNAWWVEVIVVGDGEPVLRVDGRAEGGDWHEMTYRDWGAWAASFHVPAGSDVQFRATTPNGTDESDWFTWPDAKPLGSTGAWPEEGSYARYDVTIQHAPGIYTQRYVDHVYHDGQWWTHAEGWFDHDPSSDEAGRTPEESWGHDGPTFCATDVQPGDTVCRGLTVQRTETEETHQEGDPVTVATWYGYDYSESCEGCNDDSGEWDQATGLLIGFHNSGTSWSDELLLDTDAPMRVVG